MVGTEQILTSVDGTGPDDLWVVGERRDEDQEHGVVLHRTADGWHVVPAPDKAAVLQGVTMVDGAPAVAGWSIDADGYARGLVATATQDGSWTRADLGPPQGENTFLLSLSQDASGSVWAVGFSNDSPDNDSVTIFQEDGATWTEVPVAPFDGPARLLDVASDTAGSIAVGQTVTNGASHALVLRADAGGWTVMPSDSGSDVPTRCRASRCSAATSGPWAEASSPARRTASRPPASTPAAEGSVLQGTTAGEGSTVPAAAA